MAAWSGESGRSPSSRNDEAHFEITTQTYVPQCTERISRIFILILQLRKILSTLPPGERVWTRDPPGVCLYPSLPGFGRQEVPHCG